jgi:mRNA interferase MazF
MYKQREIVLVPFPYSDLSSSKRRPVLVISNDDYNQSFDDVVVCVITSNRQIDGYSVPLDTENVEIGIMPESSVFKVHKLFTIAQSQIIRKFSIVQFDFFKKIIQKIDILLEQ